MRFLLLLLSIALVSCERYGGGITGSYSNPDHTLTSVVTQRDAQNDLLAVVTWQTHNFTGSSTSNSRNLVTHIHGHPIDLPLDHKGVYALQPDYSLVEIKLTDTKRKQLFQAMEKDEFHTAHNELWKASVAPKLQWVEPPGEGGT